MLSPDDLREEIRALRERTRRPFAVNVFAPLPPSEADRAAVDAVRRSLDAHRARLGLPPRDPALPPSWTVEDQLAVVAEESVPVLSFTFGIPPLDGFDGVALMGTATTVAEAVELERAGTDAIVVQGAEAGGHRGTFVGSF